MIGEYVAHCVIGAGFQGLPIVKKLMELGEEVICLDRNSDVGEELGTLLTGAVIHWFDMGNQQSQA